MFSKFYLETYLLSKHFTRWAEALFLKIYLMIIKIIIRAQNNNHDGFYIIDDCIVLNSFMIMEN